VLLTRSNSQVSPPFCFQPISAPSVPSRGHYCTNPFCLATAYLRSALGYGGPRPREKTSFSILPPLKLVRWLTLSDSTQGADGGSGVAGSRVFPASPLRSLVFWSAGRVPGRFLVPPFPEFFHSVFVDVFFVLSRCFRIESSRLASPVPFPCSFVSSSGAKSVRSSGIPPPSLVDVPVLFSHFFS